MPDTDLRFWLTVWLGAAGVAVYRHTRNGQHVGLFLSYVASLAALHWFASLLYVLPSSARSDLAITTDGLRLSSLAMVALLMGAEVGGRIHPPHADAAREAPPISKKVSSDLVNLYLASGIGLYLALFTAAGRLPTARAIVSTGSMLMVVGVALKCWNAWMDRDRWRVAFWLCTAGAFPVVTVVAQGFLGYGLAALVIVCGFAASLKRPGWRSAVAACAMVYLGLSVYTTYMRDREIIRSVVWSGASAATRLQSVSTIVSSFEWFDWTNPEHIDRVNIRLNQNYLIGRAYRYVGEGRVDFSRGATLWEAVLAVIPRAIWPDKPIAAGSGDLVSRFTGMRFSEDTSVGIGQVLECYVNFGVPGVLAGFFLLGAVIVFIDRQASTHLTGGAPDSFLLWYLPGLSLLQVGGSLTEVTALAGASWIVALAFARLANALPGHAPVTEVGEIAQ